MKVLAFALLIGVALQASGASPKPNVLLIMADDLRDFGGAFTRDVVKTPNIDRLRARGTVFERAYVQYPVCNPSRCSMLTGLRAEQTGIVGNDMALRQVLPEIVTLPQLCKDNGWHAAAFGKIFHLGGRRRPWVLAATAKRLGNSPNANGELFRAYCAGTSFMDSQVGRVLDELDRRQLWERTIVIFVGDHGYHTGERKWWNKNTLFERSCRAPLIIAAPGMKGGQTTRSLVEFVDLYPTVAALCGLSTPHTMAGQDLKPILQDPAASVKDAAFTLVSRGPNLRGQSIRMARWRCTRWSDGQTELYDHDADPEELHNVAATNPGVVQQLAEKIGALPPLKTQ